MSVPLDRLYNFLHDVCNHHDLIIYRFFPHGSKKLKECTPTLRVSNFDRLTKYPVICHDQEPLCHNNWFDHLYQPTDSAVPFSSLRCINHIANIHDLIILVHSEKNSPELDKFIKNGVVDVYYWSHAVIARDWFRYAELDAELHNKQIKQDFLVYNRAWSGSREYRLKFTELVLANNINDQCRMGFNPIDSGVIYQQHKFKNCNFEIDRDDLEQHFFLNNSLPSASADYVTQDYQETAIEIVLETLFDDSRQHLTEKILRPIACGHPFILASTPGSLEYLRSHGFHTFDSVIDETYDTIQDPVQRLTAIVDLMCSISNNPQKTQIYQQLYAIAQMNQQIFFSDQFFTNVIDEFKQNMEIAVTQMSQSRRGTFFKKYCSQPLPSNEKEAIDQLIN